MFLTDAWKSDTPFNPESRLLRRFLLGNAAFSTLTGTICLVDAAPLTQAFGIPDPTLLPGLGVQLLLFAAAIIWIATRQEISTRLAWGIIALDIGWVAGSIALLPFVTGMLTSAGITAMVLVAFGVATFASGQIAGVKRLSQQTA
ncbi:hypothetical protein QMT40_003022 [Parvibaculaceae bacterium PLY_AMNH_Bact1]|nr:hypothetical protein QMT40_003022 [Parvibaculaceae bacterium PLY_AMNH_Bact1]